MKVGVIFLNIKINVKPYRKMNAFLKPYLIILENGRNSIPWKERETNVTNSILK